MSTNLEPTGIPYLAAVQDDVWTAGQPTAEQLAAARDAGLKSVINLCPSGECGWDEAGVCESLGLAFHSVPVAGPADVDRDAATALHDALESSPRPVLVHCASSNRVGALFALKAHHVEGKDPEAAVAHGKAAGLTKLEDMVRSKLGC